ncbi:UvrABC system protein C [Bacteroidia bacterium]|nr:UvrABC system protein C [Bacteroidia bacterium]
MKGIAIDKDTDMSGILSEIPENPGVYMYSDENGVIIYIGKAKNLRKRIASYFNNRKALPLKSLLMIRKMRKIDYLVVGSEEESFLLENDMIKQYKPRYNVMLKDDKTYPWLVFKEEPFPRVFLTRKKIEEDKSHYYGPYAAVASVKSVLKLVTTLYPIRVCSYALSQENINNRKYHVCLQYHLKKCLGPCEGFQTEENYNANVNSIEKILVGKSNEVLKLLNKEMMVLAAEMRYEEAAAVKDKYDLLRHYSSKMVVTKASIDNVEVFSFDQNGVSAFINYLYIATGSIIHNCTIEYKKRLDESEEQILSMGIVELRSRFESKAKEIIVPFLPDINLEGVKIAVPEVGGEMQKLLLLSEKNVKQYKADQVKRIDRSNPEERASRILNTLKTDLHLKELPTLIECFDNSNTQGTYPVSACVVFKDAKPAKSLYRHYNIKTVEGPDDFSTMYEVVFRRYFRRLREHLKLPKLIIIDGGKGQLNAAVNALKDLGIYGQIPIIGIAKRLEEIYFPNDSIPLYLNKNSESLKLIQHLRDEAHRFGIKAHRSRRGKDLLKSELDGLKGVGVVSKDLLLEKYKSVARIKTIPKAEIVELIGKRAANWLYRGLNLEEHFSV